VCPSCGALVTTTAVTPAAAPAAAPAPSSEEQAELERLRGVGGWLLFFAFTVTVVGPAAYLFEALNNLSEPIVVFLDLLLTALAILTGLGIWLKRQWLFGMIKLYFGTLVLLSLLVFYGASVESDEKVRFDTIRDGARMLGYVIIWSLYFRKSKRVLATFGRNL